MAKNGNKLGKLMTEIFDFLKHPKKRIPTLVLTAIWLVMPLVTGFVAGANIPIVQFLCTLTYANGGILGGFFGMVGGIFGKAVFAAVVNGLVLSLCAKQNPLEGFKKGIKGVFAGGLKATSPLLSGAGVGLVLYWFFNVTSAPQNSAIAVVAAIASIQAIGKQNGLLFSGVFYLLKKLSKGKAPARITVNRLLTGLATGFTIGFGLTFLRYAWLIVLCGVLLIGAGVGLSLIGKSGTKRAFATAALLFILSGTVSPLLVMPIDAQADSSNGYWELVTVHDNPKYLTEERIPVYDNAILGNSEDDTCFVRNFSGDNCSYTYTNTISGEGYCSYDAHGEQKHSCDGEIFTVTMCANEPKERYSAGETVTLDVKSEAKFEGLFCYDDSIFMYAFINLPRNNQNNDEDSVFKSSANSIILQDSNGESDSSVYTEAESYLCESRQIINNSCVLCAEMPEGSEESNKAYIVVICAVNMDIGKALSYEYKWVQTAPAAVSDTDYSELEAKSEEESGPMGSENGDLNYVPYRGRLTYTSGLTNKHGQPFPDIMDYNNDGYVDYTDLEIRQKLVHNPDYLDTPQGAALVLVTMLTTTIGVGAGTAAGVVSAASGTGSALGGWNLNIEFPEDEKEEDFGRYITRDADGDLDVCDPVTGEKRLYKANGDGTYTNPLTGAIYTTGELKASLDSRAENAGLIRQDAEGQQQWLEAERERSKELSHLGKQVAESDKEFKEQAAREDRITEIGKKHGIYSEEADEVKKRIIQERNKEYGKQAEYEATAAYAEVAESTAETAKKIADVAADVVATADKTGIFKDVYSTATAAAGNAGEVMVGNMTAKQAIAKTAVDASTEVLKNRADTTVGKFAANIGGDAAQNATAAIVQGKDLDEIVDEAKKGAAQGLVDATVDYAVGTGNNIVGGEDGILTEAGENLTADIIKNGIPDIELPQENK